MNKHPTSNATSQAITAEQMIALIEEYFDAADKCDVPRTLATMAPSCYIEYLTEGVRHEGRDTGVKGYFEARAEKVVASWHGNFHHTIDVQQGRAATRFSDRPAEQGNPQRLASNVDLFEFEGLKIKGISVWKGPKNN